MRTEEQRKRDAKYFSEFTFGGGQMSDPEFPDVRHETEDALKEENARLRAALEAIAALEHNYREPKQGQWRKGVTENSWKSGRDYAYHEAGQIAREALQAEDDLK